MATENDISVKNESVSSEDSASNKSFVKKVTSTVSGFLPSSLSKWFGGTETSIRPRDETDDEEILQIQPPVKKAKGNESGVRNNYRHSFVAPRGEIDRSKNRAQFLEPVAGPSGVSTKKQPSATKAALNSNLYTPKQAEVRNCDNNSDSGESTSGYSSMRVGSKELVTENSEQVKQDVAASPQKSKSLFNTPSKHERSLFNERTSSPHMNTSLSTRQPSFNSTAFGSPNFVDRTLSSKRILDSPFYSGRTTYGGASAYGRRLAQRPQEGSAIVRNSIQIKPVNEKRSDSTSLSKTARRILDTLEQYTAPTADTKKIPNPPKKSARYSHVNPYAMRETKVPSNRELQVPTVPDLLKMKLKEKMQNTTVSVRRIANSSKCSLNTEEYKIATLDDDSKTKHSNKIKTKISSVRDKPEISETVKELKLPDVQLPITSLPVFNFSIPAPTVSSKPVETVSSTTTTVKTTEKITHIEIKKVEEVVKETLRKDNNKTEQNTLKSDKSECVRPAEFSFSNPVVLMENKNKLDEVAQFKTPCTSVNGTVEHTPQKYTYTFSDPMPVTGNNSKPTNPLIKNDLTQFKMGADKWECNTCLVRNNNAETNCVACTSPRITNSSVVPNVKNTLSDKFKPAVDTWECSVCMIRNKNDLKSCAACSSPRPSAKQENGILDKPEMKALRILDKFLPADMWKCSICTISNKNDLTNCSACGAQRTDLFDKVKSNSDTWECSTCLVRNKNNASSCIACTAAKPGLAINFKETSKQENGFSEKFRKKENQWECGSCMVRNSAEKLTCVCCDSPKPGSTQPANVPKETKPASSFNFGIVNNEAVGKMFSFGVKPSESTTLKPTSTIFGQQPPVSTTPTFTFGIKPIETKKDESNITQPIPAEEKVLPEVNKLIATPTVTPVKSTLNGDMNKTVLFGSTTKPTETKPEPAKPIFSFGIPTKPQTPEVKAPTPQPQPFAFGNSSETSTNALTPTTSTLSANQTTPAPFKFGAPATNSEKLFVFEAQPKESVFGNVKPGPSNFGANPTPVSGGFNFGSVPTNPTTPSQNGTFSFGSTTETPKPTFNFGGQQSASPGVFNFGRATTCSTTTSSTGGYNFSNSADIKPNFNFTAGAPPSTFNAPSTSSGPERRVFKRALRRTQR